MVDAAILVCVGCGVRYPIVDGVPVVVAHLTALAAHEPLGFCGEPPAELWALLAAAGPDDAPWARAAEQLAVWMDAHWAPSSSETDPLGSSMEPLLQKVRERAAHRVATALDVGASVGRIAYELATTAELTVALELHLGAARRARRILAGERVAWLARGLGRAFTPQLLDGGFARPSVLTICADALDPPFAPASFDRLVAFNVLDSVRSPGRLLDVLDGLCRPGGELLICAPWAWQSHIVDESERWTKPREELHKRLGARGYTVEDEAQLPWRLRRDAQSATTYLVDYVRAKKPA